MPHIRPFRALRFDPATVGDLAAVVAPPHDSIDPAEHERLLARHPANVVRVDLPEERSGDEPDDRYRRAARALAEWRSGAILHKDPHPSVYLYEQAYRAPGADVERRLVGYFARLRLEDPGSSGDVLVHDRRPLDAVEDRYRLLRATGVNTSPVVGRYEDTSGRAPERMAAWTDRPADLDIADDHGVRHRLWAVAADEEGESADRVARLLEPAAAGPISVVHGQAMYAAALRYRDERRMSRSCEEDPAFDYILMLFLDQTNEMPDATAPTGLVINPHEW